MLNIENILRRLSIRRPIFHSEADFQHEFAWELRTLRPELSIRLEYPKRGIGEIDIVVSEGTEECLIELKYKTRCVQQSWNGEDFALCGHAATPLGRYDAIKDISRIERSGLLGYAIFLTNEPSYWRASAKGNGAAFSTHELRTFDRCTLNWATIRPGSVGALRISPITLQGVYVCRWQDYSAIGNKPFRFLCTTVSKRV